MKKQIITWTSFLLLLFSSSLSLANSPSYSQKEPGWHKGAYLLLGVGTMNVDQDTNVQDNLSFGSDYLLGYSFVAGWNFVDHFAAELQTRFTTEKQDTLREYAANVNINIKYSLILPGLTSFNSIRFLPYLKVGGGAFGAGIPSDSAGDSRQAVWGPSVDFGAGLEMLIAQYLYVGLDFTADVAFLQEKFNNSGQQILNGGTDFQPSVFGYAGVHF